MTRTDRSLALDVLGAGPAYSDRPGAIGAAYLVRSGPTAIVLDLGQGAFTPLARALEPSTLTAVVVSHLHPDHFIDLVALRHYLRWEFKPSRQVRVLGPSGLAGRLDALHDDPGFCSVALDMAGLEDGGRYELGDLVVEAARVWHTDDSYGFRVAHRAGGTGLVYSGDCGRAEDLDALIRPGDTLLTEVSFGPGPADADAAHLDGPAVGDLAARTAPGRVLLTHLQMGFDVDATVASVQARYDGPVTMVWPGERYVIGG